MLRRENKRLRGQGVCWSGGALICKENSLLERGVHGAGEGDGASVVNTDVNTPKLSHCLCYSPFYCNIISTGGGGGGVRVQE